jgi:hypothetical protein
MGTQVCDETAHVICRAIERIHENAAGIRAGRSLPQPTVGFSSTPASLTPSAR